MVGWQNKFIVASLFLGFLPQPFKFRGNLLIIMEELIKDLSGYEGLYKISSLGKIFSIKKNRWLNPKPTKNGYIRADLTGFDGIERSIAVHRLVASNFLEKKENKPYVNHKNGIKIDNMVENLEWCTIKENTLHAFKTGLRKASKGEKSNFAKLNKMQVLEIRELYPSIKSYSKLAIMFCTSISNIYHIINRKTWSHI